MIENCMIGIEKSVEKNTNNVHDFFEKLEDSIEINPPQIIKQAEKVLNFWDGLETTYLSSYEERIQQTPREGERGEWEGIRGESKYIPLDEKIKELLSKYGMDGVDYRDGIPDFSKCSEATVEIDNMSEKRTGPCGNFEQCDQKCAERWNEEGKDGKTDWTARDVANWRRENGYSWHECNDRKTCQLVPTEINDYFGHFGGVGECKKANAQEDEFDE